MLYSIIDLFLEIFDVNFWQKIAVLDTQIIINIIYICVALV